MKKPEELDWNSLGFSYTQTPYNLRCTWKDGAWGEVSVHTEETIPMHMAAGCLHYGQESFEGLKAFNCPDGKIRLFRPFQNAERMQSSAEHLCMTAPPIDLFVEMCKQVAVLNRDYIPPYETGGSLYIRPLLIGTGGDVGVKPSSEYMLIVFCTPVGAYFRDDVKGIKVVIDRDYDRAAPRGTGHVKVGGNYASALKSSVIIKSKGYDSAIYLDPETHQFIDEYIAANFFGIKGNSYVTPSSSTVLPSITNMSIIQLAVDMGLDVERRNILVEELSSFSEVGACGTAAVIAPVEFIDDPATGKTYTYKLVGPITQQLYDNFRAIQFGLSPDIHGWNVVID